MSLPDLNRYTAASALRAKELSMRRLTVSIALVLLIASVARAADRPSQASVEGDFNNAKYREALEKISLLLNDPRETVNSDTRFSLLMLRGECMLRLRRQDLAIEAFNAAALDAKDDTVLD